MIEFVKRYSLASWALFSVMAGFMVYQMLKLPEPFIWGLRIIVLVVVLRNTNRKFVDKTGLKLTYLFIAWLFFEIIRSLFFAEGYWMYKNIINQLLLVFFYFVIVLSANMRLVQDYLALYWKFFIPMVLLSLIVYRTPAGYDYVPFMVLAIFYGQIPKKQSLFLFLILTLFFFSLTQRNDLIKLTFSSLLGLSLAYLYIPKWIFKFGQATFLLLPAILLYLASTGTFNVFKMDEYIKGDYSQEVNTDEGIEHDDLKADTRTFIYQNVFYTMTKYDAWVLGRTPAFGDEGVQGFWGKDVETGLIGRYGNEVGVMDILLWYGLIAVVMYFMLYAWASYLAIYKSKSKYARGVGVYVAFLWMWAFIWEKPMVETFFMVDLILIGLCFSKQFRQMNDIEIRLWIRGIFAVRRKKKKLIII
ncbi:MAG: hypothetical protein WKF66_19200 [Pedobacter sp.]